MNWERVATQWLDAGPELESVDMVAARRYRDLMVGLCPTLGMSGVGLIFARSLTLAARRFPFFAEVLTLDGTEAMAERLQLTLALQDAGTAHEACVFWLATFMRLLETFLGAALVARLLGDIGPLEVAAEEESTA